MTDDHEIGAFLHLLCDIAAQQTLQHFRKRPNVTNKQSDGFDPVTVADRSAEREIRQLIMQTYPDHGIIGEEEAPHQSDAEYCWIIDPVDGTRAFIAGLPSWGTLIGLLRSGEPLAGVMFQPFTGERYIAIGEGAFLHHNGQCAPLETSRTERLSESILMTTSPYLFPEELIEKFRRVESRCKLTRYGFDCYGYAMVAAGHVELVVESGLKSYDIAALIPLIHQAGGIVSTWDGEPATYGGNILAAANEAIHAEALSILSRR